MAHTTRIARIFGVNALGILVSSAALGAIGGCNLLIGLEAAELGSSSGGTTGTGGSLGTGGGVVGTGGTNVDSCSTEILDLDQERITGCVHRISCDPLIPTFTISQCMTLAYQSASEREAPTLGADSCDDVVSELHRHLVEDTTVCDDATEEWICDGDTAVRCGSSTPYAVECGELGATCDGHDSIGFPTIWACAPASAPSCAGIVEGEWHCSGNDVYTCIGGEPKGYDCGAWAAICGGEPGSAYCTDREPDCADPGTVECVGDVMTICDDDGYGVEYDCGANDLGCETDGDDGYCLAPGCDTDYTCTEGCLDDGVTLRFCLGGEPIIVDCSASIEFASCATSDRNGDEAGGTYAYCSRTPAVDPGGCGTVGRCDEDCPASSEMTDCQANSCEWAQDGECDEGGACDVGTDFWDCYGGSFPPSGG